MFGMAGSGARGQRCFCVVALLLLVAGAPGCKAGETGGCQSDAECKGDRICRDRQCVDPAPVTIATSDGERATGAPRGDLGGMGPTTKGGVAPPDKMEECKVLIGVMNAGGKSINEASKTVAESPMASKSYTGLADASEKVAAQISGVKLQVPELKRMVADYLEVMRDFAKVARETGSAAAHGDAARMVERAGAMEKVGKREEAIVAAVNKFCRTP
jgi:hypothetical protein